VGLLTACGFEGGLALDERDAVVQLAAVRRAIVLASFDDGATRGQRVAWLLDQARAVGCACTVVVIGDGEQVTARPSTVTALKRILAEATRALDEPVPRPDVHEAHSLYSVGGTIHPWTGPEQLAAAPTTAGVLLLYDGAREPLYLEWTKDLRDRLYQLLIAGALGTPPRPVRFFETLETSDPGQAAKVFDRVVNQLGRFPAAMTVAPDAARHTTNPAAGPPKSPQAGRVTQYGRTTDSRLLDKLRERARTAPDDQATLEWLAFALYSNDLLDEAIRCYERCIERHPPRDEYYFYCANALYKQGSMARAIGMWHVAAAMQPGSVIAAKSAARAARAEHALLLDETLNDPAVARTKLALPRLEDL